MPRWYLYPPRRRRYCTLPLAWVEPFFYTLLLSLSLSFLFSFLSVIFLPFPSKFSFPPPPCPVSPKILFLPAQSMHGDARCRTVFFPSLLVVYLAFALCFLVADKTRKEAGGKTRVLFSPERWQKQGNGQWSMVPTLSARANNCNSCTNNNMYNYSASGKNGRQCKKVWEIDGM